MASNGSLSSSVVAAALFALTSPLAGQSTHLTRLEGSAPAESPEPISSIAFGGWASAWIAPAGGRRSTGAVFSIERNDFAALTTVLAAARFRLGPLWQVTYGQARVEDLFDRQLLDQFPGLGTLNVSAQQLGIDGIVNVAGIDLSLGTRLERDEIVGDVTTVGVLRVSLARKLPGSIVLVAALERAANGPIVRTAAGRFTAGISHRFKTAALAFDWGGGIRIGGIWEKSENRFTTATSVRATLLGVGALFGAVGFERDRFGTEGWLSFATFGIGLNVGPVGAAFRRGGQGAAEARPTAVSISYDPDKRN